MHIYLQYTNMCVRFSVGGVSIRATEKLLYKTKLKVAHISLLYSYITVKPLDKGHPGDIERDYTVNVFVCLQF